MRRFTEHTITSIDGLNDQLKSVAHDGYVVSLEELEHGLNTVAAPIRDHTGVVIAALSVSGPVYRLTEQRAERDCVRGGLGGRPDRPPDGFPG